jgi:hypothetical protein
MSRSSVIKTEKIKSPGRPNCRWGNNIQMDLKEMESNVVEWICVAQDRFARNVLGDTIKNFLTS